MVPSATSANGSPLNLVILYAMSLSIIIIHLVIVETVVSMFQIVTDIAVLLLLRCMYTPLGK